MHRTRLNLVILNTVAIVVFLTLLPQTATARTCEFFYQSYDLRTKQTLSETLTLGKTAKEIQFKDLASCTADVEQFQKSPNSAWIMKITCRYDNHPHKFSATTSFSKSEIVDQVGIELFDKKGNKTGKVTLIAGCQ